MSRKRNKLTSLFMVFMMLFSLLPTNIVYAEGEFIYYGYATNPKDGSRPSTNNQEYYMTKDGTDSIRVYCINHNKEAPYATNYEMAKKEKLVYKKVIGNQEFLDQNVQVNKYNGDLEKNVRKVLYYLYKNQVSTLLSNKLVWEVTGGNIGLQGEEQELYNRIISGDEAPYNFVVELFIPKDTNKQTLAWGYMGEVPKPESTVVKFSKQDIAGKELSGATITLTSDNGENPQEWKSNGTVHEFTVKEGHYTFTETATPDDTKYEIATEITFDIVYNDKENKLEMKNVNLGEGNKQLDDGTLVMVDDYKKPDTPKFEIPKTGDTTNILGVLGGIVLSFGALLALFKKKRL